MTRKKVKLAFITIDSARKATYKKRKKGLMKKVHELSTLCGIKACVIIYSPYKSQPEVWPSPGEVQNVLSRFKKLSEMDQSKKMVNQESFLRMRIVKCNEQLKKQCRENRDKEMTKVMFQNLVSKGGLHNLTMLDLNDLGSLIEQYLRDIKKRVASLSNVEASHSQEFTVATAPLVTANMTPEVVQRSEEMVVQVDMMKLGPDQGKMDTMQKASPQWIVDMMYTQDHVGFGGNDMMIAFIGDNTAIARWSNHLFPWEK